MAKTNTNTISKTLSNRIEKALLYLTNDRVKDVIERRFGIKTGKPETLESIGKSYGITRERVRQIQDSGLRVLKSENVIKLFEPAFIQIDKVFSDHGYLMGEEYLYSLITGSDSNSSRGYLYLILTLGDPYQRVINDDIFHTYWMSRPDARNKAKNVIDFLVNHFDKNGKVVNESEILDVLSKKHSNLPSNLFKVVLDIAKKVDKNNFDEIGLVHWPEITPQGVKDRAYLVLKKHGEPLHFTNITSSINDIGIGNKTAYVQTVHNELIKDDRFVLCGRGTYGLKEWGYEPGTVSDVIEKILKSANKPMEKEEIVKEVLKQRQVKPTTIVLNLQRSAKTQKLVDGTFTLKK
ncbi:hypothetical protein KKA23_03320 [Patescibacteria group bacterium]|nr:hypothetical protein [Patescibacteria group bacterium]MBU3922628.1 hypothetical protein [Patescibacteria group bacterium]